MRKATILIGILSLLLSCKPDKTNSSKSEHRILNETSTSITKVKVISDTLIPISVLEEESKNLYEKYGLEFSGNCYDCDLANIKISAENIIFFNVCDNQIKVAYPVSKIKENKNRLTIATENTTFTFIEIEENLLYKLEISGKKIGSDNLRISTYFTTLSQLPKFNVHDCGDYQG